MTFIEKLRRLTDDRNKSKLARRMGLPPTAIHAYLSKGYMPRANTALRIARALSVSFEWLLDDRQNWPPVWVNPPEQVECDAEPAGAAA